MPATFEEWLIALALMLFGIFLVWLCLWFWSSLIREIWKSKNDISKFIKTNPLGEWIMRAFLAFPAFALLSMLFDPTFRTVGYFIFFTLWLLLATFLYFIWL